MGQFEHLSVSDTISELDSILANRRRRHIVGGILLSISLLFGGLAITTMTIRIDGVSEPETNDDIYGGEQ